MAEILSISGSLDLIFRNSLWRVHKFMNVLVLKWMGVDSDVCDGWTVVLLADESDFCD